ncbi:TetR/AcrR family transcriptional regulator [Streptococcus tangpeifui]|uniref:TetR/AcrR family transcriptional regulator n=1 Tax=Streptococcus tangpeifui TaxID=2709400 RepID=UPI0013E9E694|nr:MULTISPECIES: TetR/AcrR family transcriptional regulator [unclassified Streptococcus]
MRIVKGYDERRAEILAAATQLFQEKGFEKASVNDILKVVGIAKGTFYYYFKSKEEVLEAVVDEATAVLKSRVAAVINKPNKDPKDKLAEAFQSMNITDIYGGKLLEDMHKPKNALLHQKSLQAILHEVTPLLTGIIEEGVQAGQFDCPYPKQLVQIVLAAVATLFDDGIFQLDKKEQQQLLEAFQFFLFKQLGIEN